MDLAAELSWHENSDPPPLEPTSVHVWHFSLDRSEGERSALRQLLSPQEQQRADRFHFERDRHHFLAGRGLLRTILARYLSCPAQDIRFEYSTYGKPSLPGESHANGLRFNLSHSHGAALLGVARGRDMGVDVERIRSGIEEEALAERFFAPEEARQLHCLPPEQRRQAFFCCWTRKEAYLKATGHGLTMPLDSFEVTLRPDEPPLLRKTLPDPTEAGRWRLVHLQPGPDLVGAVIVAGWDWDLWCGRWSETASTDN